jgi:hypothetical protein
MDGIHAMHAGRSVPWTFSVCTVCVNVKNRMKVS